MKTRIALSLLVAAALLPACTTTKTASNKQSGRYANYALGEEPAPPGEGPELDIPAEGPADINANPAYFPTPLLRHSAAASP